MTHHDIEDMDAISSIPIGRLPVPPAPPRTDHDSQTVLDRAVTALGDLRFPLSRYDAAAQLHTLASLQADIHARIPDLIADARDQGYSWDDIATSIGISPRAARRRGAHARTRKTLPA